MSGLTPQDGRNDLQIAAAVLAVLHVDLEHAPEQLGPAQPRRAVVRTARLALGGLCLLGGRLGLLRHHQPAQLEFMQRLAALVPRPRLHLIRLVSASLRFAK